MRWIGQLINIGDFIVSSLYPQVKKYIGFYTSGYPSVLAVSILRTNGFNTIDIYGGFAAIIVYASDLTTTGQVRNI